MLYITLPVNIKLKPATFFQIPFGQLEFLFKIIFFGNPSKPEAIKTGKTTASIMIEDKYPTTELKLLFTAEENEMLLK